MPTLIAKLKKLCDEISMAEPSYATQNAIIERIEKIIKEIKNENENML